MFIRKLQKYPMANLREIFTTMIMVVLQNMSLLFVMKP